MKLYTCLLQTVDAYRSTHVQRFVGMSSDDGEKVYSKLTEKIDLVIIAGSRSCPFYGDSLKCAF